MFLRGHYFVMGGSTDMNFDVFRDFCGLSERCGFGTFPEI